MRLFSNTIPTSVYLLAICQALMMSGSTLLIAASALVCYTLTDDKSLVTLPLSLQFFGLMLTSIPASMLMGRWGRKKAFLLGSVFGIMGGALSVYAIFHHQFWLFSIASFLIGVFNGFATYFRFAAVDVVSIKDRPKAISYVMVGGVIAAFVGPNLANFGRSMFPQEQFAGGFIYITGLYVLVFIIITLIKLPKARAVRSGLTGRPLKNIVQQPTFIVAVMCGMLGYGVMSYVMTATPLAMAHHQHAFDQTAYVIQWHVLAMFAPSFFTGSLIQRIGVIKVIVIGALFALACMLINLTGQSLWHFWVALFALGIGWNFLFIGASTLLTGTYRPEETAKSQAFNDFIVFTMVTVSSLSAGIFQNKFGWQSVNIGGLFFVGIILLSVFWLSRIPERERVYD